MLNNLKTMLDISATDTSRDPILNLILSNATARLKVLLGGIDPPETLEYILLDVAVSRFNRIGSESMQSHSVEGESITFVDNDFDRYADDIAAWLESQKESTRGKLRFI